MFLLFVFFVIFLLNTSICYSDQPPLAPTNVNAFDTPNDNGNSVTLKWELSGDDGKGENDVNTYIILRSSTAKDMKAIGHIEAGSTKFIDNKLTRGKSYYYIVQAKDKAGNIADSSIAGPIIPSAQWFNRSMIPLGVGILIFSVIVIFFIYYAKSGKQIFIRRMSGLDAIDEAVGRATEMGKSTLYIAGTGSIRSVATIASMNILSQVARTSAEYDTPLISPCSDAVVMNIEREVVQNAHLDVGRPDTYKQENIFFVSEEQFAYAAAVDGIIVREKPSAIFYMGVFLAESLIFSEVGSAMGAVQIAGTDSITQLPFFITTCDYTLMGEELYAASAYLSKEPLLLGSLRGQDLGKLLVIVTIVIGVIMQMLGLNWFVNLFRI